MGQNIKYFELTKETIINVSADKVWEIAGPGFAEAGKWATNVDHSTGSGKSQFEGAVCDERSCDLNAKGFNKISEKLTHYSDKDMELTYDVIEGMPKMMAKARNAWKVESLGPNKTRVTMNGTFGVQGFMGKLMSGMMRKKLDTLLSIALNDLKVYAETGTVSDTKRARLEQLSKIAA